MRRSIAVGILVALLSFAGAGSVWADSWSIVGKKHCGSWGYGPSNTISYDNTPENSGWGSSFGTNIHTSGDVGLYNQGTSVAGQVQIALAVLSTTRSIPSYSKLVRTAYFQPWMASNRHHHGGGLYYFDENLSKAKSTWFDATYNQCRSGDDGENYKIFKCADQDASGAHITKTGGSKTMTYDNSTGSSSANVTKYATMIHSSATSSASWAGTEWLSWKETSSSEVWYYYKYITFNANGGTGTMSQQTVENRSVLTANGFSRAGYVFKGWSTTQNGSVEYSDSDIITATSSSKGTVTLYAQWEPAPTVTGVQFTHNQYKGYQQSSNYNTNNFSNLTYGSGNSDWIKTGGSYSYNRTLGSYYQACIQRYNKGSWAGDLIDWFTMTYTVPSYSSVTFTTDWCVQSFQTDANSRGSVRAAYFDYGTDASGYWSGRAKSPSNSSSYKTSYGGSFGPGGSSVSTTGTYTYYGESLAMWVYCATDAGNTVSNTVTVENSEGATSKSENRYGAFSSSKSITTNDGIFPHFTHLKIKNGGEVFTYYKIVTFDANGGTGTAMEQQKIGTLQKASLDSTALHLNTYVCTGMKFAGWNTRPDGTGIAFADGGNIAATASDKGPDTLYAQWADKISFTKDESTGGTRVVIEEHVSTADVVYALDNLPQDTRTIDNVDMSKANDITGNLQDIIGNIRNNPKSNSNTLVYLPLLKKDQSVPSDKAQNIVKMQVSGTDTTYACTDFSVADALPVSVVHPFNADAATYSRKQSSRWGTVCVPYELKSDSHIQFYTSGSVVGSELILERADTVPAGQGAIFMVRGIDADGEGGSTFVKKDFSKTDVVRAIAIAPVESPASIKIQGQFTELKIDDTKAGDFSGYDFYYYKDNKFYKRTEGQTVTIPALRAYILVPQSAPTNAPLAKSLSISGK